MSLLEAGQTFARYRVVQKMGRSASGDCYQAEDIEAQHKVVLKLVHPWGALSDNAKFQFIREMQHLRTITYPHLAEIFDYGEVDGQLYITRRYLPTGSLMSVIGRKLFPTPLPLTEAIMYTYQLAHPLYYLHMHDYVHGSLTLANILLLADVNQEHEQHGSPFVITDAGIAHFVRRFGTQQPTLLPLVVAPEQFDNYVSPASDQYALAVLLYLWLTGQPPFLGSLDETRQLKLSETFPPASTFRTEITPEQESILHKALRVYPDERYPSIIAFAEALLATLPTVAQAQQEPTPPTLPPDPLPPTGPDVPQPLPSPDPIPEPIPVHEPEPAPSPEPLPDPSPEVPPRIEPDIAQPLPSPEPIPQPIAPLEPHLLLSSPLFPEPRVLMLTEDETTMGRAESNTIVLEQDTLTSRRHAIIRREQQGFVIYDWDSIHGLLVNGQRVATGTGYVLLDGDIIAIGEHTLRFYTSTTNDTNNGDTPPYSDTSSLSTLSLYRLQ